MERGGDQFSGPNNEPASVILAPSGRLHEGRAEGAASRVRASGRPSPSTGEMAPVSALSPETAGERAET